MKGENMDEEKALNLIEELLKKVEEQKDLISELTPFIVAYKYCLESFESERKKLEHDIELMELDLKDGERGYGLQRKYFQAGQRSKFLSETLCFMCETIDEAKKGEIE